MRPSNIDQRITWRVLVSGLYFAVLAATVFADPTRSAPEMMVQEVTDQVTQRLAHASVELETDPEYVKKIVVDLVLPHFDFPTLAAAILSDYWEQLSIGERRCSTNGIRERLVERYARVLREYEYTSIVTDSLKEVSRVAPIYVTQTVMTPHPQPLAIKYKMELMDSVWKVVDLIVADISLVRSYRLEFSEEIAKLGLGDFLRTIPECRER